MDYPFSEMMFYQVLGRLFNPASKIDVASRKDDYIHDFNFVNNDNIYSSMDVFSGFNKYKSKSLKDGIDVIRNMENLLDSVDSDSKKILETNISKTYKDIDELLESYDRNFEINENKLFKHLNKNIEKIVPNRNISLAFYDCTTYYFESFNEDGFSERGMSKDNKRNERIHALHKKK